jgi:hypothetical protein
MAVSADYMNMAISLVLGNRLGTDVEYRLPNDIRKCFDDFEMPGGYSVSRGTVAGGGATANINLSAPNIMVALFMSDACTVTIYDDSGGSDTIDLNLATLVLSSNEDADLGLDRTPAIRITNGNADAVEYTYVVVST